MIVENPSKTFFYPINLPAGRLIKSATAYVKFDENPDASITFSINRRELTSLYDDDSIFFSVGSNGRNALRYTKADAAAEMNCIAIDGNGGNIPIEEGNIYYLTIQVRTDSESEIFISGVRINYDE